ncbi:scavenger receptor cysteine-rich type 1 protein M130-like [Acanthaster planci]|uniref:Scavenger receptor cysteine-rich type 1 protein M130-like n=1 Tax=Acanthaster planci TaxID=133434 RepID=A0A8B7ZZH0_ACAPL|nr:scavenger receptor cysteine-rich type 1 protein M130-like [Acanthaster planci]
MHSRDMAISISQLVQTTLLATAIVTVYAGNKDGDVKFLQYNDRPSDTPFEGVVQVYRELEGNWGGICSNGASITDATVICRGLGYKLATRVTNAAKDFPDHENKEVTLSEVSCSGSETHLGHCSLTWNNGEASCSDNDVLAVACSPITDYAVRLKGGASWYEGRVEVYHEGSGHSYWGTVCNDFWGTKDAKVICRQLKYGDPDKARVEDGDNYKSGSAGMPVLLDNVHCDGTESDLSKCRANDWHDENCFFNTELAAVFCEPAGKTGRPTTGAIVGIVIACLVVACFALVLCCLCYRQYETKKKGSRRPAPGPSHTANVAYISNGGLSTGGVAFINPGQQQPVQYIIPGAAPAYTPSMPLAPPPYSPAEATGGDGGSIHDSANPPPTDDD